MLVGMLMLLSRPAVAGLLEISGVGAGEFSVEKWRAGKIHLVPDVRRPLISPREGKFRNIYAPSVVKTREGWRIFFGGWDGSESGNDCIYSVSTRDWLSFGEHSKVVDHGDWQHVCNPSAVSEEEMVCTAYPLDGRNWPVVARGSAKPQAIAMPGFEAADINGMNALLREGGKYRLYFGDFRKFGTVYRASSEDGVKFTLDGEALQKQLAVNDVKKLGKSYLMGLHMNRSHLYYSTSDDGMKFGTTEILCESADDADKYITSVGWVCDGERLLGFLYGAGEKKSLDANRIFARWLQKRVVVISDGKRIEAIGARGPDVQVFDLPATAKCSIEIYDDDGETLLRKVESVDVASGEFSIDDSLPATRKHRHEN
jgi:hypothetical protein